MNYLLVYDGLYYGAIIVSNSIIMEKAQTIEVKRDAEPYKYQLLTKDVKDLLAEFEETSLKENRLRALLSQWLKMENVSVLMGSGCSLSHGGLLLSEMEEKILQEIYKEFDEAEESNPKNFSKENNNENPIKKLILDRQKKSERQNFEEWLSTLTTTYHLISTKDNSVSSVTWNLDDEQVTITAEDLKTFLEKIQAGIFKKCTLQLPPADESGTGHHSLMGKLVARDAILGRVHIFTLNYDTLIEQSLDHLSIAYMDGFSGKVEAIFDPSSYGLDIYYPGNVSEGRVKRYERFLHLYKLHGSINWRFNGSRLLRKEAHEKLSGIAMGIMPTSNKFSQTQLTPYSHLFRIFQDKLSQPQTFFLVTGYGFADEHVNRIIDDAMLSNPSLAMLVVEPFPSPKIKERIKAYNVVGERAFLFTLEKNEQTKRNKNKAPRKAFLDEFASDVLPDVKWLDEWFKLRKLEKSIESTKSATNLKKSEEEDAG